PDAPALVERDFSLDPPIVLPDGRAVATLRIEGSGARYPSGTAVQAYIDEELRLADGSRLLDPPFAADLLLYRSLSGDLGVAQFHLAPTPRAAQVVLETGVDRIRVFPYPGRLDRGTLIGTEGGPVPADDRVKIEIPSGAVPEPLRATAASLTATDLQSLGSVAGFRVVGGFQLTLQRVTAPAPIDLDGDGVSDAAGAPELFLPARATYSVDASQLPSAGAQIVLAEVVDQTPFGRTVRLAVPMTRVSAEEGTTVVRFTTQSIDRSQLPVDGVAREGRYLVLAAESPVAFATGTVRIATATGNLLVGAQVSAPPLGLADVTRATGIYNVVVPSAPATPFQLVPRHVTTGEGAPYTHASSPARDAIVRVDLALAPQPPQLREVVVMKGEPPSQAALSVGSVTRDVALTTNIRASFSPGIDPSSVSAESITVTDAVTGSRVSGAASADGTLAVVWTLTAGQTLQPNGRYVVVVAPTIRGTNGAVLGRGASFTFETVQQVLNTEIRRERIRITIPTDDGVSRITGDPGALPAGWQAVAVRRGRDFNVRYQATAAGDGSFSFFIGNGGDANDRITIGDLVDLRVVNSNGALAAIFALTPFASEDGKSFVVPAGAAVRYTTPEGLTLDVPAGAFDVPTVISVNAATKQEFLDIEAFEAENEFLGSVNIEFDGVAKKPLRFEAPIPAGFDPAGKTLVLAQKMMSPRGPRLAIIDLMAAQDGKLVTDHGESTNASAVRVGSGLRPETNQTLTGSKFTRYLQMLIRSGVYSYHDIRQPVGGAVGWAVMEGLQANYDLMWDIFFSYFIPHIHVFERGGALLPIVTGKRFTVVGIDAGTGLQGFSRTYDPIPFGPPGTITPIEPAQQNDGGPYPVFGSPFRVEMLDLEVEEVEMRSIRNFVVRLENGTVYVTPGTPALPSDTKVTLLNVSKGSSQTSTAGASMQLPAEPGNRIVLLIEERQVDPTTPISIVFNEPIYVVNPNDPEAVNFALQEFMKVEHAPKPAGGAAPNYTDITRQVRFSVDSGERRVNLQFPSALQSNALYRLTLKEDIADSFNGNPELTLGTGTVDNNGVLTPVGGGTPLELHFSVRSPAGQLGSFTATPNGMIRGMELSGNLLFVAAWDGGLRAYDVSNPAALTGSPASVGEIPGPPTFTLSHLAVTIDRHDRIYTTAHLPIAGLFRSYRVEEFKGGYQDIPVRGSKIINWVLGYSSMIGLPSNTVLSDVPESIPFRIKVVLQDDETNFVDRKAFVAGTGASESGDFPLHDMKSYTVSIGRDSTPYKIQRITIENLSLDMKWSADAKESGPAVFTNVVARSTDRLRLIRNQKTFAIVAHLGHGIGVYDANAIESNRASTTSTKLREQLVLTAGLIRRDCSPATPTYGIVENYITTDAELRGAADGTLYSYSTDPHRGVLDLHLRLPSDQTAGTRDDDCDQRDLQDNTGGLLFRSAPEGMEADRMKQLKSAFSAAAGRQPYGHVSQLARFFWSVPAHENPFGVRGTTPGQAAEREYLLVASHEWGLVVVDIDSNPLAVPLFPLWNDNIADIIWIPGGAVSVRVYQSANIAVVGDRYGRAYVVDLSRIDERFDENGQFLPGLFETAKNALAGPANDPYGVGADDPRILWKSEPGAVGGSVAPVFDPYTGMLFTGNMLQVKVHSAIDPRVTMKVNLGDKAGLSEVGGVVPLGVPLPADIEQRVAGLQACDGTTLACKENASLAAFRLEVSLPGDMSDSLAASGNELWLAVESERVAGAVTE
ncbi:MAG TPA: Ig-like domain-containing protein, partial [Thermoanaerobaculia bacterium]